MGEQARFSELEQLKGLLRSQITYGLVSKSVQVMKMNKEAWKEPRGWSTGYLREACIT